MPGNTISINNQEELSWYVGDSKMDELIEWLNKEGIKEYQEENIKSNVVEFLYSKPDKSDSSDPEAAEVQNKSKMDMLNDWVDQLIFPGKPSDFIQELGVSEPSNKEIERKFYFYTDDYRYMIVAIDRVNDNGYLGCQVSSRKPRAGEDWTRGNDLPDGPFNKNTWDTIVNAILNYEIVKLSNYRQPETIPDEIA